MGNNVWLNFYPERRNYKTGLFTYLNKALIIIGTECLINGAIIHARNKIIIGDNYIIAAGSVFTKDVPENQLFGSNPAKFIKNLDK